MSERAVRVLVADDDPTARLLMKAVVERAGFEILMAEDGEQALRQFGEQPCDIVMLDVDMPRLSGYEVCARLRDHIGDELPIVMVTGMDDLDSVASAFEAGATDFISKPINWALIVHRIRYLLRSYQVMQDLHTANARNAAVLDAIPDALLGLDADGRVLHARRASGVQGGWQLPGPGDPLSACLPAEVTERLLAAATAARSCGNAVTIDYELDSLGSGSRTYEARLAAVSADETLCLVRDITERMRAEAALRKSESRLRQAQSVARLGSWHLHLDENRLEWSEETYRIFGVPQSSPLTLEAFLRCVHPDDALSVKVAWEAAVQGAPYRIEHRIIVGGEVRWVLEQAELERDDAGRPVAGVGSVQDITEQKLQELEILTAQQKLRDTLEAIPDLLFEVDLAGRYLDIHARDAGSLAAPPELIIGRTVEEVLPPNEAATCLAALREANEQGVSFGRHIELDTPGGRRWFELSVSRKSGGNAAEPRFIVLSRDITERKQAENSVYRLAYFDPLTGLPNRLSFFQRLEREIARADTDRKKMAVLFLDLDGFKTVNDTLGHGTGDLLLQWVANRLQQCVRPSDVVARADMVDDENELARLGGDEFTVMIPDLRDTSNVLAVAHRIHELLRRPFAVEGREVVLTASIGVALFPDDGVDAATLLKHADTAMYHAKDRGRNNCQFYSSSLTQEAVRRLDLASDLRAGLEREEFLLAYQPQLDVASGRIRSVEALIRWNRPGHGQVSPMEFIPLAEENGLIVPIGDWVLRQACGQAARWSRAGLPIRVAVNLSAVQFAKADLVPRIRTILAESGLAPCFLELEVTEGTLMEDTASTLATLRALRGLGVCLSLDDFGTGYSSLSYLKRLPLNIIKVDKSFVSGLPADRESLTIVRTIVALAKNLGFNVTAEGVETDEQANILRGLGCETLQGYFISLPMSADAIEPMLSQSWCAEAAT